MSKAYYRSAHALAGPMRVLIVPMYLMVWLVIIIAQVAVVVHLLGCFPTSLGRVMHRDPRCPPSGN